MMCCSGDSPVANGLPGASVSSVRPGARVAPESGIAACMHRSGGVTFVGAGGSTGNPAIVQRTNIRDERVRRWLIWGLVGVVAVVHTGAWLAGGGVQTTSGIVQVLASWVVTLALAVLASRRIGLLRERLSARETAHRATLDEIEQLQTQNAMLQIVARSVDVRLAFQALALRIARLVPCDRVGLALLTETGQEFETSTARVREDERRARPRPDVVFKVEGTAIGHVARTAEPMLVGDLKAAASEFIDINVLHSARFRSVLLVPLVSNGRAVGTLNVVSRNEHAFDESSLETLRPIAEILAVAYAAQQLHHLLARYRTIETMADVMLSIATEVNSALQIIVGHCDLIERSYPDPALHRDLSTVVDQSHRISELLERMRRTAHDRLKEVATTMEESGIPTSPEAYEERNRPG